MTLKFKSICLILVTSALSFSNISEGQKSTRIVNEKLLSGIPISGMLNGSYTISNDLQRIAFRIQMGKKQIAVVDTFKGKPFDIVGNLTFSNNGKRYAYPAKKDSNWLLIIDNRQEAILDTGYSIPSVYFTPDGKNYAYLVNHGHKTYLVNNGIKGKTYDHIDENSIVFSADSRRIAYSAVLDKKQFNVVDGEEGPAFDQVGFPLFSNDGKRVAYWGITNNQSFAMVDNQKSSPYASVGTILFNKDGKHCVYSAVMDDKHVVVLDGIPSEKYDLVHSLNFSPEGARVAYGVQVTVPEKEGYSDYMVMDGKKIGPYQTLVDGSLKFSPDGSSFAYTINHNDQEFLSIDGKPGNLYGDVLQSTIAFSPNNLRIAYGAERNSKRMVVTEGKELGLYDDVYSIVFSPDNKRLAYSVKSENKEFVVVDGNDGKKYDSLLGEGKIIFDSPNTFHYLGIRENSVYLVEEKFE